VVVSANRAVSSRDDGETARTALPDEGVISHGAVPVVEPAEPAKPAGSAEPVPVRDAR
jgi:hypothetical protein